MTTFTHSAFVLGLSGGYKGNVTFYLKVNMVSSDNHTLNLNESCSKLYLKVNMVSSDNHTLNLNESCSKLDLCIKYTYHLEISFSNWIYKIYNLPL